MRSGEQCAVAEGVRRDNRRNRKGRCHWQRPRFLTAQLLGPPTEPNAVGRLGRGGARERREGCPGKGVPTGADFATTRAAGIRTLWHCGGGKPPPYR